MEGYYLSQHGNEVFVPFHQLQKDPTNPEKPLVFVAKGSHAHYVTSSAHRRYAGCAWDLCGAGHHWRPRHLLVVVNPDQAEYRPDTMGFLRLNGYLGDGLQKGSVTNCPLKSWWMHGQDATEDPEYLTDSQLYNAGREWVVAHNGQTVFH